MAEQNKQIVQDPEYRENRGAANVLNVFDSIT